MADKIKKLLETLSQKERDIVKLLLLRLKLHDLEGLDIKQLKGHSNLFRVRKGRLRILYSQGQEGLYIVRIDRRDEKTYKGL